MEEDKVSRLSKIEIARGIQVIVEDIFAILKNPIVVFDMEYKLLAHSGECDDIIWNEFISKGTLGKDTLNFFESEGFIEDVANSTMSEGVTYLISDKLRYNRVFGQITNRQGLEIADFIIIEYNAPLGENIAEEVRIACQKISEELSLSPYYGEYGSAIREQIIKMLLEGEVANTPAYTGYVANIDKSLKSRIYAAVLDLSEYGVETRLSHLKEKFRLHSFTVNFCNYQEYIVVLLSCDDDEDIKDEASKLSKLIANQNIRVGISDGFENIFEVKKYYLQAVEALGIPDAANNRFFWHNKED